MELPLVVSSFCIIFAMKSKKKNYNMYEFISGLCCSVLLLVVCYILATRGSGRE